MRDGYPVQLRHAGRALADVWACIDRQALLEDEHRFNACDYGLALYDAILVGAVGRAYQRLIGGVNPGEPVRVQLEIHGDAPELHALPWERLFHVFGQEEVALAADAHTPFSRFLVSGAGDQPPVRARPLRVLVAIANPEGLPAGCAPLDVAGEVESLAAVLGGSAGGVQGSLLAGRSGLPGALRERLLAQGWTLHEGVTNWRAIQRWLPGQHVLLGQHVLHILAHG